MEEQNVNEAQNPAYCQTAVVRCFIQTSCKTLNNIKMNRYGIEKQMLNNN